MSEEQYDNPDGEQMEDLASGPATPEEPAPTVDSTISLEPDAQIHQNEDAGAPGEQSEAVAAPLSTAGPASEVGVAPTPADPKIHRPGMNWYIIHTYSGFENKVAESLRARSEAYVFQDRLGQVLIPVEEVVELRNGKKVTSKRMLYPGYVMVQAAMDDEIWHHIKNTPRVTGFVGGGNTPVPLSDAEVDNIFNRQASAAERPRPKLTFEKSETVRIVDGPFTNFQGKVEDVNVERSTLRVLVTIFGRATPVELEFLQVEKI